MASKKQLVQIDFLNNNQGLQNVDPEYVGLGARSGDLYKIKGESDERLISESDLEGLQPSLISGQNIKTINNKSIIGSGNLNTYSTDLVISDLTDLNRLDLEGIYNVTGSTTGKLEVTPTFIDSILVSTLQYYYTASGFRRRRIMVSDPQTYPAFELGYDAESTAKSSKNRTLYTSGENWTDVVANVVFEEGNYIIIDADDAINRPAVLPVPGHTENQYNCSLIGNDALNIVNRTLKMHLVGTTRNFTWDLDAGSLTEDSNGTSGSTIQTIEVGTLRGLDNLNLAENLYIVKGGVKGQLIVIEDEVIVYSAELSAFICDKEQEIYSAELSGFSCAKQLPLNLITASFETHTVTITAQHHVASDISVGFKINNHPETYYLIISAGQSSNVHDAMVTVSSVELVSITPESDSEYDYYIPTI